MNKFMNKDTALNAALRCAALERNEIREESAVLDDGYWVLCFATDELRWECYVDALSGEVPGLLTEPVSAAEALARIRETEETRCREGGASLLFVKEGLAEFRRRSGERELNRFWSDMRATKTPFAQRASSLPAKSGQRRRVA